MMRLSLIAGGILLFILTTAAAGTGWSLHQVPQFYREALSPPREPARRQQQAKCFVHQTLKLVDDMHYSEAWAQDFTEEQVNSWLAEELPRNADFWLPPGVSEPRIHLTPGAIDLAFRYRDSFVNTVISARLKPEMRSPNLMAVEITEARAGGIPVPMQFVLAEISDSLHKTHWQHELVEEEGRRLIVIDLHQKKHQRTVLESIQIVNGGFSMAGRCDYFDDITIAELFLSPAAIEYLLLHQ